MLQEADVPFAKTHELGRLLDALQPVEPIWQAFRPGLIWLNVFAVQYRYPGRDADREMAKIAMRTCREIRAIIRAGMGL